MRAASGSSQVPTPPEPATHRRHQNVATLVPLSAATHCLHLGGDRRCPLGRLPGHLRVATEAANAADHNRGRKREARPESSRDLPSHYLVPYRLDTPPPSPVTQRRRRLVSSEVTWPRSLQSQTCPDLPALLGTRLRRCRRCRIGSPPVRPSRVMSIERVSKRNTRCRYGKKRDDHPAFGVTLPPVAERDR